MGTDDYNYEKLLETEIEFLKSMYPNLDAMAVELSSTRTKARLTVLFLDWCKRMHPDWWEDFKMHLKMLDENLYKRLI